MMSLDQPEYPQPWLVLASLANCYRDLGDKAKARPLLKRADAIEARAKA